MPLIVAVARTQTFEFWIKDFEKMEDETDTISHPSAVPGTVAAETSDTESPVLALTTSISLDSHQSAASSIGELEVLSVSEVCPDPIYSGTDVPGCKKTVTKRSRGMSACM